MIWLVIGWLLGAFFAYSACRVRFHMAMAECFESMAALVESQEMTVGVFDTHQKVRPILQRLAKQAVWP